MFKKIDNNYTIDIIYIILHMEICDNQSNDTIFDQFLFLIDQGIEYGNPDIILEAIKNYRQYIGENYIKMAEQMYLSLIQEKLENIAI